MLLNIDSTHPQPYRIKIAIEAINDGKLICYPTDTNYGIGCSLHNKQAIERVYRLKKKERSLPISIICCDIAEVSRYAEVSNSAFRVMRRAVPGPYTFILPASHDVPKLMLTRQKTVGIRIPDNLIPVEIVRQLGAPIVNSTISDLDGETIGDPLEIERLFSNEIAVIIDGGIADRESSTIVDLSNNTPVIIREGKGDLSVIY